MKGSPSKAVNAEAERRALVVLGMHRSGTSAMTRMLSLLGAALPKRLMPPMPDNEAGFWEPSTITALNDEILEALDSEWDDVFSFRPREYLSNFDRFYLGKARELLDQEFNGAELIVLKDPRVSVLTNFWDRALRAAGFATSYVAMVRNPLEVAESLRSRNSFPREKSLLLWSSYMLALERDTRELQRIFISYDELLSDWRRARRRIEDKIGIPFPRDTAAAANDIDRFLDRRLRHHESDAERAGENRDIPRHVSALYRIFLEASRGGDVDYAAIEGIYEQLCEIEKIVGPVDAGWRAMTRDLLRQLGAKAGIEAELASAVASKEETEAKLALVSSEREALDAELSAASGRADALERQLAQANSDHQAHAAELAASLAAAKAERDRAVEEADLKVRHAEEQTQRKIAHVAEQWRSAEASLTAAKADLQSLAERLSHSDDELQRSRDEISSLNGAVREHEDRAERKQADLEWLRLVHEVMENSNAGWRRLMPRKWRRKRQLDLLRRRGLFDSAAYLDRYPDVQQAGLDPLYHYLAHGMDEGRAAEIRDDFG